MPLEVRIGFRISIVELRSLPPGLTEPVRVYFDNRETVASYADERGVAKFPFQQKDVA